MRAVLVASCLVLASCGVLPITRIDTARLQPGELGTGFDPDVTSVNLAQWAYADPARTRGRPVDAARAAAAMDYAAGELNTSPRWSNISAITQMQLLQGREQVRAALGVVPGTPSQAVVDHLIAAAYDLQRGDQGAALVQLGPPVFGVPASTVLARLYDMPYLQMANVSTMRAGNELFLPNDNDWR